MVIFREGPALPRQPALLDGGAIEALQGVCPVAGRLAAREVALGCGIVWLQGPMQNKSMVVYRNLLLSNLFNLLN